MNPFSAVAARKRKVSAFGTFTWYSTYFNGVDDVHRGGGLTGAADSKLGLISFWIKMASTSSDTDTFPIFNNASIQLIRIGSGHMRVIAKDSGAATIVWIDSGGFATMLKADGWMHIAFSWDTGTAGRGQLYKNGVDASRIDTLVLNAIVDYTVADWGFASGGSGGNPDWLISEFYFTAPATWFDLSNSTNLQKFRTVAGKPENLGSDGSTPTGTAPLVYMHNRIGGSPSWFTNQGTGGNFTTLGGVITDGGADKP